ncbi:hypothetical protein ACJIZ3_002925 [Penstemon smallii]|uniref:DOG1 domain-containing protein n=1 Tax=Penstemon smallii TaxID=265156 RepID=A0ABD3U7R8_9LAMI
MASSSHIDIGSQNQENFEEFYVKWKKKQDNQLQELVTASKTAQPLPIDAILCGLIHRVIAHYEDYYQVKSKWVQDNVLLILSPQWRSPLENAFLWIGGWRPTTAFQLLHSVSGDLGDLSSGQMNLMDNLQRSTTLEERKWTEKMAKQEQKVADAELVELSHEVSESIRIQGRVCDSTDVEERVDSTLKPKKEGLEMILLRADDLRLRTLKSVIEILSPIQAVHFLIAVAELQLRVHDWGKHKEQKQASGSASNN